MINKNLPKIVRPAGRGDYDTIPHVALDAAHRHGCRAAIFEPNRCVTFHELANLMMEGAAAFVSANLKKGDRVALWAQNSIDWVVACLSIQAAGGVVVPLNTRLRGLEAQFILNKSSARFLVSVQRFLGTDYPEQLHGLELPHLERIIALDTAEQSPGEWATFLATGVEDLAARKEAEARLAALEGNDISDIMFTSGTTGDPKGVITNHRQNVQVFRAWTAATGLSANDRYLIPWPFFHCAGYKSGILASLIVGATMYPQAVFNVEKLMETVAREKITFLPGPPTLFLSLLSTPHFKRDSFSSLRVAVTGAANVPPSMIEEIRRDLGIERVLAGYGLTETCGIVTMSSEKDSAETIVNFSGKPIPGIEVKCIDDDGNTVPTGAEGEVLVRGFNVMQGYLDDIRATNQAIDASGWLRTGDIGMLNADGYLRITDRKTDMYITGGFNCYPAEIERIMSRHPAIAQVAVAGVADSRMGEVGKAWIVLKADAKLTAAELVAWCRSSMANYKAPRHVEFVNELPLNAMGKVQKFRL